MHLLFHDRESHAFSCLVAHVRKNLMPLVLYLIGLPLGMGFLDGFFGFCVFLAFDFFVGFCVEV